MTISELIAALERIRADHGDLLVLHHDDWSEFLVEAVEYEDGLPVSDWDDWYDPPHVLLTGARLRSDGKGGLHDE